VLAGVQNLPASPATARALAGQYAAVNGLTAADVLTSAVSADGRQLTVTVSRRVQFYFARALNLAGGNFDGATVTARASAGLAVASGARDIVPFGIVRQNLVYGSRYVLKEGAGGGYNGNFGALALGGRGASVYRLNIQEGYDGVIRVGDYLTTETGNMSGPTRTGVNYRISLDPCATYQTVQRGSPRIVTVPIIDSLAVNGRSQVLVVGFASFFLEGVGGNGNLNYVEGRFMQMIDPLAETDTGSQAAGDYGLYRVRLVQ
ncbi:MAG: hypothetical protein N3A57_07140, partial [Negativicutes bacterium]|nr:hypothetical protein [Negativicutes bacterium]